MATETLTTERILEVTEEVLRRHGPAKATVVDVARALGVSHGSVYRHFGTKAQLREAVTKRWLDRTTDELQLLMADGSLSSPALLRQWFSTLFAAKRRKAGDDPQLFATYQVLISENSRVVELHVGELITQLDHIIQDGVAKGQFRLPHADPALTARAVFDATNRFHDPAYAGEWQKAGIDAEFNALTDLVLRGLDA
ncbi:TetR family transcriptional regulator [Streptomyces sp. NPDC058297]|uniref:TetR family transcriptional regulator n=1 Tax=Streptomyces sp. NPDC058297 TaxID=3346433 RepID=UPI0036EA67B2